MPPDGATRITGRCYCGASRLAADADPSTVAYCHCPDCRRVTGAPVAAFAAFAIAAVKLTPDRSPARPVNPGVRRTFCPNCGSPLTAAFDYLPGQVFVPLGILDQADALPPTVHCHAGQTLPWLHIDDDADRIEGSARQTLGQAR